MPLVCPQNSRFLSLGFQLSPVYPIRRLYPLQLVADMCHLQPDYCRIFRPILPPQLSPAYLQGLLVLGHWRL